MKHTVASLALVLAASACNQPRESADSRNGSAERAGASQADAVALGSRAEKALGGPAGGEGLEETLPPFTISAISLTGTEPFAWGTDSWGVQVIAAHAEEPTPRGTLQFETRSGRMLVNLPPANGFRYYVECDVRMGAERMALRWDALMDQAGPVNGTATLDPATKRYYFVTPAAGTTPHNRVFFTIDAQLGQNPPDSHWLLNRCDVLPFKAD
jgi:hypothetical protein